MNIKKILSSFYSGIISLSLLGAYCITFDSPIYASSTQSSKKNSKSSASTSKKTSSNTSSKGSSKSSSKSSTKISSKKVAAPQPVVYNNRSSKRTGTSKKRSYSNYSSSYKSPAVTKPVVKNDSLTLLVNEEIINWLPKNLNPGGLRVNFVEPSFATNSATISLNENFTYLPVTKELIRDMKKHVSTILPDTLSNFDINFIVGDKGYSYYINTIDKLPEKYRKNIPFVIQAEPDIHATRGMEGDIVAMWASHGRYFKPGTGNWYWQRPQLFEVAEDTHTMSYVYPYIVPMIENAGGYVMMPRERDINKNEVIVDNDTNEGGEIYSQPYYKEVTGSKKWETGKEEGFIYDLPDFRDTENPFENGTYRQTTTVTGGKQSYANWFADIPEEGEYAVYVSYKTVPGSTDDALYTINYSGGSKQFKVNQQMGGGTWIYLGTFPLEAGYNETLPVVSLSNLSKKEGKVLTADAVKIGGGMGNISRSDRRKDVYSDASTSSNNNEVQYTEPQVDPDTGSYFPPIAIETPSTNDAVFSTSGLPRFLEGARYWMHWAGAPEEVYSPFHGTDDYKDDYTGRGHWVNWLAGGSRVLPGRDGLKIPIDISMALHSDAGKRDNDTFIGTLGIYYTNNGANYADGTPRSNSRTLTDMLMRQITMDIRQTWEPDWTRRSMWDKSYLEARVPEVPASLIEFMSHQNFADMMYALDPAFRFTVGRAIYKAIGRFISERKDRKFIVQPLPVKDFAIIKEKKGSYKLVWKPTEDPLEPTANPTKYFIYERTADQLGFHKVGETSSTIYSLKITDNLIHSYKIIAANDGGVSFPSEILALKEGKDNEKPILIINGFDRVSAPASFASPDRAGFDSRNDFGVPYIRDISFIGHQTEFRRAAGDRFGLSDGDYYTTIIAGNTFDFPYIHGRAIAASGRGFVSTSAAAVEKGEVNLNEYKTIDLILGKQKATVTGNGTSGVRYIAFPQQLQDKISKFVEKGGNLFVSGAYVASDLYSGTSPQGSLNFANNVLGISLGNASKSYSGQVKTQSNKLSSVSGNSYKYNTTLNEKYYIVENPDILAPSGARNGQPFLVFTDTGATAGIFTSKGNSKGAVMSIPFETFEKEQQAALMKDILNYLEK